MKAQIEMNNMTGFINTRSGLIFSLLHPEPEMIDINDISHGLAYKGHFAGQTPEFFSIAQHCILVTTLLPENAPKQLKLAALLHDASEAYIGDMIKPLKIHLPYYCKVEYRIMAIIFKKFNLNLMLLSEVKPYDIEAQRIEFGAFYENKGSFTYLDPDAANYLFIKLFYEFINE